MPRHNTHQNLERKTGGYCKIRKRVSSSSSSSSVVRNYRLKRAILAGKRTGSSTPVPTWKVKMAGSKSPLQKKLPNFENGVKYGNDNNGGFGGNVKGKEALSARKLAATLWEINGLSSPGGVEVREKNFEERRGTDRGRKSSERIGKVFDSEKHLLLDHLPHSPLCQKIDRSKVGGGHRRRSSATSQKFQITEYTSGELETVCRASSIEVASHVEGENDSSVKTRLKDVSKSLIACKELVKVLFRMMAEEELHSSRLTLVSALRIELDRARIQVDQSTKEQRFNTNQANDLLRRFEEEKAAWKSKEKEQIREAMSSIVRELEIERKLRRQAERLNKKLGVELADTRAHFTRAMRELDAERRAREILERTCDDLAKGIGEERVEVEELKRESAKAREEVEKERQMLLLADVLREERVQMKLSEARYEYEEKNAALERLKGELETYLKNQPSKENRDGLTNLDLNIEFKDFLSKMQLGLSQNEEREQSEDSGDSELHSIELNMNNDNNKNEKGYKWSFAFDQGDMKRSSTDEVFKGRKSLSEKIQWENICLQRQTSDGIEWDFSGKNLQGSMNGFERGRSSNGESNEDDNELKKYKLVKSQRLPSCQESAVSPALSTGQSSRLREACSAILQDLATRREQLEGRFVGNKR